MVLLTGVFTYAQAEDAEPVVESAPVQPNSDANGNKNGGEDFESHESEEAAPPVSKKAKNVNRAKEAEGSKAPNRFEADVVSKSYYRVRGEPLEVDPD